MHFELARCDDGEIKRSRGPKKFINIIKDLASAKNRVYGGDIPARDPAGVPNVKFEHSKLLCRVSIYMDFLD